MEVTISPDATLVAAGNLDAIVRIWDIATGALLERLQGHKDGIYSVAFISDGKGLVSGSLDKSVKYWDVSALAAGSAESKLENATPTDTSSGPSSSSERPEVPCTMDFVGHKVGMNDFRNDLMPIIYSTGLCSVRLMTPDSSWVAPGSKNCCVHFWDPRNASLGFVLKGHNNPGPFFTLRLINLLHHNDHY